MLKKTISFAACTFIALASCNSIDPIEDGSETDDIKSTVTDNYDYYAENLGMAVHKAIADSPQARQLIKDEVMKQFDGDYDLLLSNAVSLQVDGDAMTRSAGTVTFGQLLESYIEAEPLTRSSESFLDELMEKYPDMQISVPVHADEWDPQTYTPNIAIVPSDYIDLVTETVPGIDSTGNNISIDAINEPDVPVIVVSRSERFDANLGTSIGGGSVVEAKPIIKIIGEFYNGAVRIKYGVLLDTDRIKEIRLYRTAGNSSIVSPIAILDKEKTEYSDWNIATNSEYVYHIILTYEGLDGKIYQAESKEVTVITDINTPNAVEDLNIEPRSGNRNFITWRNIKGEDYPTYIYRTTPTENEVLIAQLDSNADSYFDENTTPGVKWTYTIRKYNKNVNKYSPSVRNYVYNPYRNPEAPSKVMLKKIYVNLHDVEGWLGGKPECYILAYGVNSKNQAVPFGSVLNIQFARRSSTSQDLNNLLCHWNYYSDERFYPAMNFHMIEYDIPSPTYTIDLSVLVGIKFLEFISLDIFGSLNMTYQHKDCDCGIGQILYYENPEKVITLQNYGAKLFISDKDDNDNIAI